MAKLNCFSRNKNKLNYYLPGCVLLIIVWLLYMSYSHGDDGSSIYIPNIPNIESYQPIEPYVTGEFPLNSTVKLSIPRIIHQVWTDSIVPAEFVNNVKSFVDNHADWQYYFWTHASGRKFIQDQFPWFLKTYDAYRVPLRRADALRYFILYTYGGVYVDLDTISLKPLGRVVAFYPCILVPEPQEHVTLLYHTNLIVANGILFSRPHHPFFKQVMHALPTFKHFDSPMTSTGPQFFTQQYLAYQEASLKQSDTHNERDTIYIANSQYFLDRIDPTQLETFDYTCSHLERLRYLEKRGCASYVRRGGRNRKINEFAYNDHTWGHILGNTYTILPINEIKNIVPKVRLYK